MKFGAVLISLILIILIAYGPGLGNKPVAEDFDRPEAYLHFQWTNPQARFVPVFGLLKAVLEQFFGLQSHNPVPYHLVSIWVHAAVTVASFSFYKQTVKSTLPALVGAVFFAVYPRHHEPVFRFSPILHPMMTLFFMGSLLCADSFLRSGRGIFAIVSFVLFALSLLSAEAAVAGAAILLGYFFVKGRQEGWTAEKIASVVKWLGPLFIMVLIYGLALAIRAGIQASDHTLYYHARVGPGVLRDFIGYLSYSLFFFVPLRQASLALKALMAVTTFVVLLWLWIRGDRWIRFGVLWMAFAFAAYSMGSPFGNSDRYFYFPGVGLGLIVSGLVHRVYKKLLIHQPALGPKGIRVAIAFATGVYAFGCVHLLWERALEWRQAGEMAEQILLQIYEKHPSVTPGTTFFFWNLPARHGQAYVLFNGVQGALIAHYKQPDLRAYVAYDREVLRLIKSHGCRDPFPNSYRVYIYVYEDERLVECSDAYRAPAVRDALTALSRVLVP